MEVIRIFLVHSKPSAFTAFPDLQVTLHEKLQNPIKKKNRKMFQKLCLGHINSYPFLLNSSGKAEVLSMSQ